MRNKKKSVVIDLFCGIGGLSYGFVNEGFEVIAGYDNDPTCEFAYKENNLSKFCLRDITELKGSELLELYGENPRILVGCAPCQPFSSYSFKVKDKDEKKLNMLYTFSRLVEEVKPIIVSMENVPQLARGENNKIFNDFCNKMKSLGYYLHYEVVYCPEYGIPQTRKRLVLLASLLGEINLIPKTHDKSNFVTVRDAIGKLKPIKAGEFDLHDKLHRARSLNSINIKRIQHTKEGGGWKDWPEELLPNCYKKKSGKTYGSVYGRMKWDTPAPTMTTHCTGLGNGRFGHPEQDRAISLREAALIQTFPKEYMFFDSKSGMNPSVIARQIGNAVPPRLGEVIAKSIKNHLKKFNYEI